MYPEIKKRKVKFMKKAELIQAISDKTGLSKKDTTATIDAALEVIEGALVAKKTVSFIGFGTFSTAPRAARSARVPGTDKVVEVPASTAVKFKVGKKLKEAVANS
ncbi:MAG: HU family DNA-binding protein [Epsilonproteobacteria bacterium]|nr:HU family DNA-binding protein [Campylobacterota bacterium]